MPNEMRDYIIAELAATGLPDVPISASVDRAALVDGDPDPMFVTLPVVQVGTSRNNRYYDKAIVAEIAKQINDERPGGQFGHLQESERSWRYDKPEVLWIGATERDGVVYGKGYIPPTATSTRDFLKRAKAAGHKVGVSIYGRYQQVHDAATGAMKVQTGGNLESIDFAPASRAGMAFGGAFALSAEMTAVETDAMAAAIAAQLRREMAGVEPGSTVNVRVSANGRVSTEPGGIGREPLVVSVESSHERYDEGGSSMSRSEVIQTMTVAEMAQLPQAVREQIESERRAALALQLAPVREVLGLAEDAPVAKVVTTVTEMATAQREADEAAAKQAVDTHLDAQLAERVAKDAPAEAATKARATVRRLVVAEMRERTIAEADRALTATLGDETVTEMVATLVKATPSSNTPTMVTRSAAVLNARHGTGESKFARTPREF